MVFERIDGQEHACGALRRALRAGLVHHAYRFEGPNGVGKEAAALALAQSLLCGQTVEGVGCGKCNACRRSVEFGQDPPQVPKHPDVVLLGLGLYPPALLGRSSPETTGIGVEQVRRLVLERAGRGALEGRSLVFIVRAAHELTLAAANALLKTLEEPRRGVHFVLLTDRPRALPDTLRSRTLPLRFGRLSEATLRRLLKARGLEPSSAALASGSMERALEESDPERQARVHGLLADLDRAVRCPDLSAAVALGAEYGTDRGEARQLLLALCQHLARTARLCAAADGEHAASLSYAEAHSAAEAAREALSRAAPGPLTIEALVSKMRKTGLAAADRRLSAGQPATHRESRPD